MLWNYFLLKLFSSLVPGDAPNSAHSAVSIPKTVEDRKKTNILPQESPTVLCPVNFEKVGLIINIIADSRPAYLIFSLY